MEIQDIVDGLRQTEEEITDEHRQHGLRRLVHRRRHVLPGGRVMLAMSQRRHHRFAITGVKITLFTSRQRHRRILLSGGKSAPVTFHLEHERHLTNKCTWRNRSHNIKNPNHKENT